MVCFGREIPQCEIFCAYQESGSINGAVLHPSKGHPIACEACAAVIGRPCLSATDIGQPRGTQHRIKSLLDEAGWDVGCDRVQRIWRREGLKVPKKQRPRGRLWLNDGSCIRLRPERRNHVWSYDFVEAQTHDGRKLRLMTLIDEFTRECLAIRVARRINSFGVLETMADVMLMRGVPSTSDLTTALR